MSSPTKLCGDCEEPKPLTAFSVKDRARGYLNKYCKPCDSRRTTQRQAGKTAERIEYNRRWRAENPERVSGYNRKHGALYRERHPDYWPTYYAANRERRIRNTADWRVRNPERYLTAEAARRLRKRLGCQPDALLRLIDEAVSAALPPELREDACQELALRVLVGDVEPADLKAEARQVVKELWRMHGRRFGTVSLDAPLPGGEGVTYADTLVG